MVCVSEGVSILLYRGCLVGLGGIFPKYNPASLAPIQCQTTNVK
jgi:hypothetical protein